MGLDELVKSRLGRLKMFKKGTHTATETGARRVAGEDYQRSQMGQAMKSLTGGTKTSEEYIRSAKYKKPGGK